MLDTLLPLLVDLVAIVVVVSCYFRRHQRRDLLLAYVALNIGVLAVTTLLASGAVSAGLGLGLFGILSIIRLRSDAITQEEIAYYFVSLALGLLAGLHPGALWVAPALSGLLVAAVLIADHPRLLPRARRQLITMDRAVPSERELRELIETRMGVQVKHMIVQEVDFVRDTSIVDVRFRRLPEDPAAGTSRAQRDEAIRLEWQTSASPEATYMPSASRQ